VIDDFVKNPPNVIPGLTRNPRQAYGGQAELIENIGFWPQFIPYLIRGQNDDSKKSQTYFEFINYLG